MPIKLQNRWLEVVDGGIIIHKVRKPSPTEISRWQDDGGPDVKFVDLLSGVPLYRENIVSIEAKMVGIIADATRNAIEVCSRSHIKGTQFDRISEFVTQLRRGIGGTFTNSRDLVAGLADRNLWYDAGQVNPGARFVSRTIETRGDYSAYPVRLELDIPTLKRWCQMAADLIVEDPKSEIEQALESIRTDLGIMHLKTERIDQIGQKADVVLAELVKVLEPLEV